MQCNNNVIKQSNITDDWKSLKMHVNELFNLTDREPNFCAMVRFLCIVLQIVVHFTYFHWMLCHCLTKMVKSIHYREILEFLCGLFNYCNVHLFLLEHGLSSVFLFFSFSNTFLRLAAQQSCIKWIFQKNELKTCRSERWAEWQNNGMCQ